MAPNPRARGLVPVASEPLPSPSQGPADEPSSGLAESGVEPTEPPKTVTRRGKTRAMLG